MASVLSVRANDIKPPMPASRTMSPAQEPTPPHNIKQEDEVERGRRRSRSDEKSHVNAHDHDHDDQGEDAKSSNSEEGPARKRRRSRKGLDKKFECPSEGCGKSYSRAEHL